MPDTAESPARNDPALPQAETGAAASAGIFDARVRLLYRLSRPGYLGTLIAAIVVALALWSVVPQVKILSWLMLVAIVTGGRIVLYRRFVLRQPGVAEFPAWRRRFIAGAVLMGCTWGLLGSALMPSGEILYQLLLMFIIGGMVTTALVVLTPVRLAFYGFSLAALLPLIATTFAQTGPIYLYVGLLQLVFTGVIMALAPIMHRNHVELLETRYENQALVARLSTANQALSARVEAQRAAELELQRSSSRLDALVDASPLAIIVQDSHGVIQRWNRAAERIFGWRESEVLGRESPTVPDDKRDEKAEFLERIRRGEEFLDVEAVRRRRDGASISVSISAAPLLDAEGKADGSVMIMADVSERKRVEQLQLLEHMITRLLSESQSVDEALRDVLRTFCQVADWAYGARWVLNNEEQKLNCVEIWHINDPGIAAFAESNRQSQRDFKPRLGGLLRGVWTTGELVWMEDAATDKSLTRAGHLGKSGLHAALAFPILILGKFYGVIEFFATERRPRDDRLIRISRSIGSQIGQFIARKEAEQNLTFFANHDTLTGLPNRAMFAQRLGQAVARAQRNSRKMAVMFVDLDRFKVINDTLGHDAGDRLLQEAATRLRSCLREGDTIARQGGDEFVVLVEDMVDPGQAAGVAQKILDNVSRPYMLSGQEFSVTASVGVSIYPEDASDVQALMKNADIAMYRAKDAGKNNFQFYSAQANRHSLERLALETDLRHALDRGELQVHYLPKIDARSGRITGGEALIRWTHPVRGVVSPSQLIALAEETGLIIAIGDWVLRTVCGDCNRWAAQGLPVVPMAVNLSVRQFGREGMADSIAAMLNDSGLEASQLELEITESAVMDNAERAAVVLERLHAMGVRVALDDFGTGYSSLGYLKRFPVDSVKIDRSFISDIPQDKDDVAITRAVIAMAHSLQLKVVAEGVETAGQARFLREHGCDELQGYLFGEPCDAAAFGALLTAPPRTLA